jgi:ribosomal protein S18 acetylase RimI-like enzyme
MMLIRPATPKDLQSLVALHYSSGVLGLLSKLTPLQLSTLYYEPLLASRHSSCFVAESLENDQIVGVIVVSSHMNQGLADSFLLRLGVAFRMFTQSLRFPDLYLRILQHTAATRFLNRYKSSYDCLEIQLLLVNHLFQSSGIGSALMDFFLASAECKDRIVVQTQNISALDFYSRFEFKVLWKKSILGVGLWICERKI